MKTLISMLLAIVAVSTVAPADEVKRDYGFKHTEDLRLDGYELKLVKAVPDKNHWRMGYFKFRWNGAKAVRLWGFGFEKDGSFRVRFESLSKKSQGEWKEVEQFTCGTGARMFTLEPDKEYVFQIPLSPYEKGGEQGVVMLGGEKISVVSEPFNITELTTKR